MAESSRSSSLVSAPYAQVQVRVALPAERGRSSYCFTTSRVSITPRATRLQSCAVRVRHAQSRLSLLRERSVRRRGRAPRFVAGFEATGHYAWLP